MKVQEFMDSVTSLLNFCSFYYVVQLVRCALVSFAVCGVVFFLRKTLLKNCVLLKGALWSLFIPVLFTGKMTFYYENKMGLVLFSWCSDLCIKHIWICRLYLCGMVLCALLLFRKRKSLKKWIAGMEKRKVDGVSVYVTKMPVTPSTIGILRPKIVMPEVIMKEYGREEIRLILLHEKTHIRLGHLLLYLYWDVMRVLLWPNPLMTVGTKFFREDLEEICDWVTMKRSGVSAYTYGQLLLKSIRALQTENRRFHMIATFSGDQEYQNIRRRVTRIAGYKPYGRIAAAGILAAVMLCVTGAVVWIHKASYARCNESENILAYQYNVEGSILPDDDDSLKQMISYDDSCVYVDREAFDGFLRKRNATGEIFIIFGGYFKLPGVAGVSYSCCYEPGSEDKVVKIPYEKPEEDWMLALIKML